MSELSETLAKAPLPTPEHLFSKGLLMPFNCTNSGVRKLMFSTNLEQRLPLIEPDVPFISTGYEAQFGAFSSSFEVASEDYTVIARIPKFYRRPMDNYTMIFLNAAGNKLFMVERSDYQHLTETFGYIKDNTALDILQEGDVLQKGTVLHKSKAFDEHNLRQDGRNLLVMFNASEETMEDSIIISDSCAKKLASPLVHKFNIILNINDIPLNIFGDQDHYKIIPDIGSHTKDDILCAIRKERKEEAFFAQAASRLNQIFLSDDKYMVSGTVVDLDVRCNNPEMFSEFYFTQINEYYQDHLRFCRDIVDAVNTYYTPGGPVVLDYPLQVLYDSCVEELNGGRFINEKVYTGCLLTVTVVEEIEAEVGDKATNRYGGKGVISRRKADALMPKTYDGETIDIQINMCGVYGRENAGQLFEMEFNYRSREIVKSICDENSTMEESIQNVLDFLEIVSPKQHKVLSEYLSGVSDDVVAQFLTSIVDDGMIYLDVDPGSDTPSLDTLIRLDERFPWIQQRHLIMPIEDSNGKIRYVNSRRPMVYGHVYYYRLKQHSEEKFSVTSLAATNLRNENSRNKASKVYKAQFPRTPIRFGDMELGDLDHLGVELVIQLLMLYSASPEARMLSEQAMTGNPYNVDIQLEDGYSNTGAEIFQTYLKGIGQRLRFFRVPKKKIIPITTSPFRFILKPEDTPYEPFIQYAKDEKVDLENLARRAQELSMNYPFLVTPFTYDRPYEELDPELERRNQYWKDYAAKAGELEAERLARIAAEVVDSAM